MPSLMSSVWTPRCFLPWRFERIALGIAPVADLDRIAVLDETGHVVADPLGDLRVGGRVVFKQGFVIGDQEIDIVDVEEGIAVDTRHVAVDLDHENAGRLGCGLHDVDADPHAQIAVLVRKRGLEKRHVHMFEAPPEEARHLGEIDRRVVGKPLVDGPAGAVADEEGVVPEIGLEFLVGIGGHPEGPDVQNLRVEEGLGVFLDVTDHGVDEVLGLGAGRGDEDRIPPVDVAEDGLFRSEFLRVALPPDIEKLGIIFHGWVSLSASFRLESD